MPAKVIIAARAAALSLLVPLSAAAELTHRGEHGFTRTSVRNPDGAHR